MDSVHFLNLEYIFLWIYETAKSFDPAAIVNWLVTYILTPIRPYAAIITLLMIVWIVYSSIHLGRIAEQEEELYGVPKEAVPVLEAHRDLSEKWAEVEKHMSSNNPNDWRVAIVDADIMLGTILTRQGYAGDTIGDQLKAVDKSDMLTLQDAWNAHKVRNDIAHAGTEYQLNERDARATIALYKKVFQEFYYI